MRSLIELQWYRVVATLREVHQVAVEPLTVHPSEPRAASIRSDGIAIAGISTAIGLSCGIEAGESLCQHNRFAGGFAPVAGPWIQLGYDHEYASVVALFAVPGAAQIAGLTLMIAGGILELRAR